MVFLKEFFEKIDFEKNQQTTKKHEKLPSMQRVKIVDYHVIDQKMFWGETNSPERKKIQVKVTVDFCDKDSVMI